MKGQSTKDNKIQLTGATCELATDDVTKINQNDALSLLKCSTNGEASSGTAGLLNTKWIAPAIEMIIEGMNDPEGSSDLSSLIDPLLLSSANLFKTIIQTNLMELDNHQRLAVGLFILKLLLYSEPDSNDQNQIDTKPGFRQFILLPKIKWGSSFQWRSPLYCSMRNPDQMTIGKTHSTLINMVLKTFIR